MSLMASPLIALVVAAALSVVSAYPTKDDDAVYYNRLLQDTYNNDVVRNLDGIDDSEESQPLFAIFSKPVQVNGPEKGGGNLLRELDTLRNKAAYLSRDSRGSSNLPQISPFDSLGGNVIGTAKRNAGGCCDSLSGIAIGNQKRNMDEIDRSSFNSFIKKNFDEIDRSGFGSFVKRNFDEIDRSGFGSFVKRSAAPSGRDAHN